MKTKQQAFTLVEVLIVIVIFAILVTVLFRTFNTITELSLRSEFQKTVQSETLFVNQVFHSLADQYTIDFKKYEQGDITQEGLTDTLHLIHADDVALATDDDNNTNIRRVTISTQDCEDAGFDLGEIQTKITPSTERPCKLMYQENDETATPLTTHQVKLSHIKFQLIPYQSNRETLANTSNTTQVYQTLAYPGFVFYGRIYHRGYGRKPVTNISQVIHRFFTLTDQAQL